MAPPDFLQQYFWRARRTSQCVPEQSRLGWQERLDTEEKGLGVSSFCDSILTLGLVIAQVMLKRDAHWGFTSVLPPPPSPALGGGRAQDGQAARQTVQSEGEGRGSFSASGVRSRSQGRQGSIPGAHRLGETS